MHNLPTAASFLVTEDCNLACKYCFELGSHKKNKMSKKVARKGLDYLCANAVKGGVGHFSAMIFGGEPFLAPDIIEEIFCYGTELANKNKITFSASIVTNATILTDKIKRLLLAHKDRVNLSVQLSIDGVKESHDMYRVTKNGKGSFDIIEKNIPGWKELFADNFDRLCLHGCLNKDTLKYLYESYIFFREEWDIPRIWFMPVHSEQWDDEDVEIYKEQLDKIADYIIDKAKKTKSKNEVLNYAPIDRCLNHDSFPSAPCGAGKHFVTFIANGDIYPCHQFYFNDPDEHTKIGTLDTGIDDMRRKIFMKYDSEDLSCFKLFPDCDACHCYRCIAENWQQNGSILSVVDCGSARCKMSRIEREIQLKVRGEVDKMGLLDKRNNVNYAKGNNPDNPECLCDLRGGDMPIPGCEIVGNNPDNPDCLCDSRSGMTNITDDGVGTIAMALKALLDKVDTLEKGQSLILKKLL